MVKLLTDHSIIANVSRNRRRLFWCRISIGSVVEAFEKVKKILEKLIWRFILLFIFFFLMHFFALRLVLCLSVCSHFFGIVGGFDLSILNLQNRQLCRLSSRLLRGTSVAVRITFPRKLQFSHSGNF